MRARYDDNGNISSYHSMVFDSVPDDYEMQTILTGDKFTDLSYVGIMKLLNTDGLEDFSNLKFYSSEVLSHMALDYIKSAQYLHKAIVSERDGDSVSYYVIPCAFACKHSIELKLKECLIVKGTTELRGHSVLEIWNDLDEKSIPHSTEITTFLKEVEKIDNNEIALRYGVSKKKSPLQEEYKFDVDRLINNTMFLFNVLEEYVICKYRHNG